MTRQYAQAPNSTQELRDFYNKEFKRTVIKDEDRAYRWMAQVLFKPYVLGKKVLDIGCGGGFFLRELQSIAAEAFGTDISEEALRIAMQSNSNKRLVQAGAEALPYQSQAFNCVFCLGSLEHFLDIRKALCEMKRIVQSDGWIFVMVPNLFWYKDIVSVLRTGDISSRNQHYEFFATPNQWKKIIEDSGLRLAKRWKYNGISASPLKQWIKDRLIPTHVSYHLIFGCRA